MEPTKFKSLDEFHKFVDSKLSNTDDIETVEGNLDQTVAINGGKTLFESKLRPILVPWKVSGDEFRKELLLDHLNICFCGSVDSGKSTVCGHILLMHGKVDERDVKKYEKSISKSQALSAVMDLSEEERKKGKTVEVSRAPFSTPYKRYTILDCPGHSSYTQNICAAVSQADVGILIASVRGKEFEAGFERGGQTRQHAILCKALGVTRLIVMINKMDDPYVKWSKEIYDRTVKTLKPFLKKVGFPKDAVAGYIPCSGKTGENIRERKELDWYKGPTLIGLLDQLASIKRDFEKPWVVPIIDYYTSGKNQVCLGKIEQGVVKQGDKMIALPSQKTGIVSEVEIDDLPEFKGAIAGDNLKLSVKMDDDYIVQPGEVLCPLSDPVLVSDTILVKFFVIETPSMISKGWKAMLHIHTTVVECELLRIMSKQTGKKKKKTEEKTIQSSNLMLNSGDLAMVMLKLERPIAVYNFEKCKSLGRFTIRSNHMTVGVGTIEKIKPIKKK